MGIDLKKILSFKKGNTVAGIEAYFLPDGKIVFNLVVIQLRNNKVSLKYQKVGIPDLNELKSEINNDWPIALNVSGRGIMFKKFNTLENNKNLVSSLLPNANSEEFYLQTYQSTNGTFVSISRKSNIDALLKEFYKEGLNVISSSFGPFPFAGIAGIIEVKLSNIVVNGYSLAFKDAELLEVTNSNIVPQGTLIIGEEGISLNLINAFAAGFQLLVTKVQIVQAEIESVTKCKAENENKIIFTFLGWLFLICFFIILIINFFLFSHLSMENDKLSKYNLKYQNLLFKKEKLQNEVNAKESFLSQAGWLSPSKITLISDKIGKTVPPSIQLTEMMVNPYEERESREQKKEIFSQGKITISGVCSKPTLLNSWILELERIPQIESADVTHYIFDNKENVGKFNLTLLTK